MGVVRSHQSLIRRSTTLIAGVALLVGANVVTAASAARPSTSILRASLVVTPKSALVAQVVTADLHLSSVATGTGLRSISLSWGDGTKPVAVGSLKTKLTHRYLHSGRFVVSVLLVDSHNHTSKSAVTEIVTTPTQHVYWDLFNGSNSSYMLESASLPLTTKSVDNEISGTTLNKLTCTAGMTFDSAGRLWVLSYPNGCSAPFVATIQVFNTAGGTFISPILTFTLPGTGDDDNLAFDSKGNLWVEDVYNKTVMKFTGPFTSSRTLSASVTLSTGSVVPSGLAVDSKGDLFVANVASAKTHSIAMYHFPVTSSRVPVYLNGLSHPGGLIFDQFGNLLASTNPTNGVGAAIVRYNANHLVSGAQPNIVDSRGMTGMPYASNFAWDLSGDLYVADCGNHAGIREYPRANVAFSATLAPSVTYVNSSLQSVGCAWGIAIH